VVAAAAPSGGAFRSETDRYLLQLHRKRTLIAEVSLREGKRGGVAGSAALEGRGGGVVIGAAGNRHGVIVKAPRSDKGIFYVNAIASRIDCAGDRIVIEGCRSLLGVVGIGELDAAPDGILDGIAGEGQVGR